jgi:hypothetical protein
VRARCLTRRRQQYSSNIRANNEMASARVAS